MTKIDEKFLREISNLSGRCAFRGQENSSWKLHSSAMRRLMSDPAIFASIMPDEIPRTHLDYHRDELIAPARAAGFGIERSHKISDLQLLAKLQHFGAATGLMDFTWNPLVALWFACKSSKNAERNGEKESDGKVFIVNLNNPQGFWRISHKKKDQSVQSVFFAQSDDRPLYWEPMIRSEAAERIVGQASVFVIGRPFIPEHLVHEITVSARDKALFRRELADIFGITEDSLFRDVHGFSTVNGVDSPIKLVMQNPEMQVSKGNALYQQGRFSAAIRSYNRSIALRPDVRELYCLRGNARAADGDYPGALSDYDKAEDCKRLYIRDSDSTSQSNERQMLMLLFNRGNVKAALNDYVGAIADYGNAINYCRNEFWHIRVAFNRGNSQAMLQRPKRASQDYDYVIEHGAREPDELDKSASFNKGNMRSILGEIPEAVACYEDALPRDGDTSHVVGNLKAANKVKNCISGGQIAHVVTMPEASKGLPAKHVEMTCANMSGTYEPIPFSGNVGSIGNIGGPGLRGGPGFPGGPGFAIQVLSRS